MEYHKNLNELERIFQKKFRKEKLTQGEISFTKKMKMSLNSTLKSRATEIIPNQQAVPEPKPSKGFGFLKKLGRGSKAAINIAFEHC